MVYTLESSICLAICYLFYRYFLEKETFFQANRLYLMAFVLLSFALPMLNLHWESEPDIEQTHIVKAIELAQMPEIQLEQFLETETAPQFSLSIADLLFWIWASIAVLLLVRFFYRLASLFLHIKIEKKRIHPSLGIQYYEVENDLPTASFFGFIFLNNKTKKEPQSLDFQLVHEQIHAKELHSVDVLLMEMVCIFSWFNPLVYAYRKSLREVHEFIADAGVISKFKKHKIQAQYALCLVSESSLQQHSETCLNTFHNHLKTSKSFDKR